MNGIHRDIERFDAGLPIERARTPPASWYVEPAFLELERAAIFRRTWQAAGRADQVSRPGDFVSGDVAGEPYVVVRGEDDRLRAFFNVCRHHATCLAQGAGRARELVCPYHGWTYGLDGRLLRAPRMAGVEAFRREELGLVPMEAEAWGPLVFVRPAAGGPPLADLTGPLEGRVDPAGLRFVRRVSYEIECNWKVFVDNYLDGGYHVAHLHGALASQLELASYRTEIAGPVSLQVCDAGGGGGEDSGDFASRLEGGAVYAFLYPNFMINRYGPIMDTNWVLPLGPERTLTVFDYYFERSCDDDFIERSLAASDRVQHEDIAISESVQRGLRSSAFDVGRYAPRVEEAAHQFHRLLSADLRAAAGPSS